MSLSHHASLDGSFDPRLCKKTHLFATYLCVFLCIFMFACLHSTVIIIGSVKVDDDIPHEALSRVLAKDFCNRSLELSMNVVENSSGRKCCLINGNAAAQMRCS